MLQQYFPQGTYSSDFGALYKGDMLALYFV